MTTTVFFKPWHTKPLREWVRRTLQLATGDEILYSDMRIRVQSAPVSQRRDGAISGCIVGTVVQEGWNADRSRYYLPGDRIVLGTMVDWCLPENSEKALDTTSSLP